MTLVLSARFGNALVMVRFYCLVAQFVVRAEQQSTPKLMPYTPTFLAKPPRLERAVEHGTSGQPAQGQPGHLAGVSARISICLADMVLASLEAVLLMNQELLPGSSGYIAGSRARPPS